MTKTQISRCWTFIYGIILLVSTMLVLTTALGLDGFRYLGARVSVSRDADYKMYKVDARHALYVLPSSEDVSLVTYKDSGIFSFLGKYSYDQEIFPEVCQKDGWLYTKVASFMAPGRLIAYHQATAIFLKKEEPIREDLGYTPVNLERKGLLCNSEFVLNPQKISNFPELDVAQESSITVAIALACVHILWLLLLPFAIKKVTV